MNSTGVIGLRNRMSGISSWSDASPADPYQMVFVVMSKLPDGTKPSEGMSMRACASAMIGIFNRYGIEMDATDRLDAWVGGRIRKIVKHAHGRKWDAVSNAVKSGKIGIPSSFAYCGDFPAIAFAPMRKSEMPPEIDRLQVSGLLLPSDEIDAYGPHMSVIVNGAVAMTSGKAIAQACHVVNIAVKLLSDEQFSEWKSNGFACSFTRSLSVSASDHEVAVRDAGFTEVVPGSLTAVGDFVD